MSIELSKTIVKGASKLAGKLGPVGSFLNRNAPTIMTVGGIACMTGSIVLACKGTTKLPAIMEKHDKYMKMIEDVYDKGGYPDEDGSRLKETIAVKAELVKDLGKEYGPALLTAGSGIALILGGRHILNKRFTTAVAGLLQVQSQLADYRNRVKAELGDEADLEFMYGVKEEEKEIVTTTKSGKEKTKKTLIKSADLEKDPWRIEFLPNVSNPGHADSLDYNLWLLQRVETWCNDRLLIRGRVTQNDLWEKLNIKDENGNVKWTVEGQRIGWINEGPHKGERRISLGLNLSFDDAMRAYGDFIDGGSPIILHPNYDGYIWTDEEAQAK